MTASYLSLAYKLENITDSFAFQYPSAPTTGHFLSDLCQSLQKKQTETMFLPRKSCLKICRITVNHLYLRKTQASCLPIAQLSR